jgi:uncharacterized damage-inducible protein DinB
MITPEYAIAMAAYNQWMNKKVYDAASQLSDEERRADKAAFFKSIHATLSHLVWGDSMWMSRFTETPSYAISNDTLNAYSFTELTQTRYKIDDELYNGRVELRVRGWLWILLGRALCMKKRLHVQLGC